MLAEGRGLPSKEPIAPGPMAPLKGIDVWPCTYVASPSSPREKLPRMPAGYKPLPGKEEGEFDEPQ
eukprot:751231-Hanusia_phi.AAC.1